MHACTGRLEQLDDVSKTWYCRRNVGHTNTVSVVYFLLSVFFLGSFQQKKIMGPKAYLVHHMQPASFKLYSCLCLPCVHARGIDNGANGTIRIRLVKPSRVYSQADKCRMSRLIRAPVLNKHTKSCVHLIAPAIKCTKDLYFVINAICGFDCERMFCYLVRYYVAMQWQWKYIQAVNHMPIKIKPFEDGFQKSSQWYKFHLPLC